MRIDYTYDAWGRLLTTTGGMASTLGLHNPLRYRGYVYDTENGLYYLQTRYYNPTVGRFINADVFVSTGQGLLGYNMFAYCGNNPVKYFDYSGKRPLLSGLVSSDVMLCCDYEGCGASQSAEELNETSFGTKMLQAGKVLLDSVEFSVGLGQGMYVEFELFEMIGVGVGMYGNYGTLNYSDGEFYGGQEIYSGISGTLLWYEFGAAEHIFTKNTGEESSSSFLGFNTQQESLTLFSFAFYPLFAGFSVYVGLDTISLATGWDEIF